MKEDLLIDWNQLDIISDYDPENLRFLVEVYFRETGRDMERLKTAVTKGEIPEVERLARGCAGASSSYGMIGVVPDLQTLEKSAKAGKLDNALSLLKKIEKDFLQLQVFFSTASSSSDQAKAA